MLELKRYNGALVTPRDDALLYDFLINDTGVFEGLTVTHLGANQLLISAGRGIIKGRDFTAEEETILANLSDSGEQKGRLLIRVDLANEAAPIQFVTQVAATLPALVQEDINRDGTVYELPLAEYDVDELQISNLTYVAKKVLPQGGVYPATCTYSSGVFTLSGLPDNLPDIFTVRFKAPADYAEGDTLSINAMPYALFMPNQQPAQAGAFAQSAVVSLNIDLTTGKAFVAGGEGGGEWVSLTHSWGEWDSAIGHSVCMVNKSQNLLYVQLSSNGATLPSGKIALNFDDTPFTGNYSPFFSNACFYIRVLCSVPSQNTNKEYGFFMGLSDGQFVRAQAWSGPSGSGAVEYYAIPPVPTIVYIPPENWL